MQRTMALALTALVGTAILADEGKERAFKFSKDDIGKIPKGWKAEKTGRGEGSVWKVVEDDTAPSKSGLALAQTAKSPGGVFNICVAEDTKYKDVELSVSFKAVAGEVDRAAGLVFRLQDANNYYIVRANSLEDNYRLYHVIKGSRKQFAGANFKVTSGEWHELKVECVGNKIICYYDGQKKIEATDDTFKDAGKVGLWTKADSVTYFDDLVVKAK